jgi:D-3-phosphoglycerate dehydrogenase
MDPLDPLLLPLMRDLLEWIGKTPRTYEEVMDGWRTSCPRLPVWEECTDQRLVARRGRGVELTARGRSFLEGRPQARAARPPSAHRSRAR